MTCSLLVVTIEAKIPSIVVQSLAKGVIMVIGLGEEFFSKQEGRKGKKTTTSKNAEIYKLF
jgi:hypothetical protein